MDRKTPDPLYIGDVQQNLVSSYIKITEMEQG